MNDRLEFVNDHSLYAHGRLYEVPVNMLRLVPGATHRHASHIHVNLHVLLIFFNDVPFKSQVDVNSELEHRLIEICNFFQG